jgi:hypothetical protein
MFPPSSESDESSSCALSFIKFGDLVAPGAHQNRFAGSGGVFWFVSEREAWEAAAIPRALARFAP